MNKLVFSPYAYLKLLYLLNNSKGEVSCFGLSSKDNLLYVEELMLIKQKSTVVTTEFEDEDLAKYFELLSDKYPFERFSRIWIHTHPGKSPQPSYVDENTFKKVFGRNEWSLMFIISKQMNTFAKIQYQKPRYQAELGVEVDWSDLSSINDVDTNSWQEELDYYVQYEEPLHSPSRVDSLDNLDYLSGYYSRCWGSGETGSSSVESDGADEYYIDGSRPS